MKINAVGNYHKCNNSKNPSFGKWREVVLHEGQEIAPGFRPKHMNHTWFFRSSPMWEPLVKFLINKYKDVEKINVYSHACSDGSEPLSFAMIIKSKFKEVANKFLPFNAKDYDEVAIKRANDRYYLIGYHEKGMINKNTNDEFDKYFEFIEPYDSTYTVYKLKPDLYNDVKFSVADILKDYKKIKKENSFVMARNFWPYLSDEDKVKLAYGLSRQMKKNCTLMIGDFDLENRWSVLDLPDILEKAGFKPTKNKMLYTKG